MRNCQYWLNPLRLRPAQRRDICKRSLTATFISWVSFPFTHTSRAQHFKYTESTLTSWLERLDSSCNVPLANPFFLPTFWPSVGRSGPISLTLWPTHSRQQLKNTRRMWMQATNLLTSAMSKRQAHLRWCWTPLCKQPWLPHHLPWSCPSLSGFWQNFMPRHYNTTHAKAGNKTRQNDNTMLNRHTHPLLSRKWLWP